MAGQLDGKVALVTGAGRGLGKVIAETFEREGASVLRYRTFHEINQAVDRVDILVNNLATQGPVSPLLETAWPEWSSTIDTNLLMPVLYCEGCLECGVRKIINLSGGGITTPRPGYTAYVASKAALVAFSATLAAEYPGVDINCVAPGDLGPMGSDHAGKEAELQRAADLVLFLASARSDGITGRLISAEWDGWQSADFAETVKSDRTLYTLQRKVVTPQ